MPRDRSVLYRHFSPETNRLYVLYQEPDDLPNLEISGAKMKSSTPSLRAILDASLTALRPLVGVCLDTCGGLGYSAIAMAASPAVECVTCFEVDANVIEAARHNPEARALFEDSKIELQKKDVVVALKSMPEARFDRVFHDPPRLAMAGELYSLDFYRTLWRVMKPGAKLFHYTGAPGEKRGKDVRGGVIRRLNEAGFVQVRERPDAQGVSALRPTRDSR
ncbi:MAG TPA: RsmD family RNA methyltransferase [Dehalococcoidia bacterium]